MCRTLFFAALVPDPDGSPAGVVALEIASDALGAVMRERAGLGATGETYLVGPDSLMRSASRFVDGSVLSQRVDTDAVRSGLRGESGSSMIDDYRGEPVLSVWTPLDIAGFRWVLLAEQDAAEVQAPITALRRAHGAIILAVVGSLALVALVVSRQIATPVVQLSEALDAVSTGDITRAVAIDARDEIGDMALSYERMRLYLSELAAATRRVTDGDLSVQVGVNSHRDVLGSALAELVSDLRTADQSLRDSNERFRLLLDAVPDLMFRISRDGTVLDFRPVQAEPSLVAEDALGRNVADVFPHNVAQPLMSVLERALDTGQMRDIEYDFEQSGGLRCFEARIVPSGANEVVVIARDVTEQRQAKARLRQSEQRLLNAQRIAHLGNWEGDVATGDQTWSDEIFRIFGLTPRETGATYEAFLACIHPDDRDRVERAVGLAVSNGHLYSVEHRIVRPDGSERIVLGRGEVVRNEAGAPVRMVGTVQDVTEERALRQRAEVAAEEIASVLASAPNPIIVVDQRGTLLRVNDAVREVFGWEPHDLLGQPVDVLIAGVEPEDHARFIQRHVDGLETHAGMISDLSRERVGRRKDGSEFPVEVRVSEMPPLEGMRRFTATVQDITERRQGERDRELARLTEVRASFLATMSHELRTPLNSVLGFAQVLERQISGPLNEHQLLQVRDIIGAGSHLLELITDVLDLSKIDAEQWQAELGPVRPAALTDEVLRGFSEVAAERGLELRLSVDGSPDEVVADGRSLRQILVNLISNAVKFTERGWVEVRVREQSGDLVIEVEDTGVGIAHDDLDRIFAAFTQIDSGLAREYQGTGLGLTITKRLSEAQGGELSVRSRVGEGSTFTVRIPLAQPADGDGPDGGGSS